jgi:hypothetical protein
MEIFEDLLKNIELERKVNPINFTHGFNQYLNNIKNIKNRKFNIALCLGVCLITINAFINDILIPGNLICCFIWFYILVFCRIVTYKCYEHRLREYMALGNNTIFNDYIKIGEYTINSHFILTKNGFNMTGNTEIYSNNSMVYKGKIIRVNGVLRMI